MKQREELYPQLAIPAPVRPKGNDLLVCERDQFHRLLTERGSRVLFYMGSRPIAAWCVTRSTGSPR